MPGTFAVDHPNTFAAAFLMSASPKPKFGDPTGAQEAAADGQPKWLAEVAVTFLSQGAMKPISEVLTVTITGANPATSIQVGSPVLFDGLRVGVNPPEKRDNGTIRGGRLWYSAVGLRSAAPARSRGE
jgi:hypothetical protein